MAKHLIEIALKKFGDVPYIPNLTDLEARVLLFYTEKPLLTFQNIHNYISSSYMCTDLKLLNKVQRVAFVLH